MKEKIINHIEELILKGETIRAIQYLEQNTYRNYSLQKKLKVLISGVTLLKNQRRLGVITENDFDIRILDVEYSFQNIRFDLYKMIS